MIHSINKEQLQIFSNRLYNFNLRNITFYKELNVEMYWEVKKYFFM